VWAHTHDPAGNGMVGAIPRSFQLNQADFLAVLKLMPAWYSERLVHATSPRRTFEYSSDVPPSRLTLQPLLSAIKPTDFERYIETVSI